MTEQDMKDFIASNADAIKGAIREKLIEGLVANHRWQISDHIATAVSEFITAEIVPEVKKLLQGEKGAILLAAQSAAQQIGDAITKQMVESAAKNVSGYGFRKVMEGIFG